MWNQSASRKSRESFFVNFFLFSFFFNLFVFPLFCWFLGNLKIHFFLSWDWTKYTRRKKNRRTQKKEHSTQQTLSSLSGGKYNFFIWGLVHCMGKFACLCIFPTSDVIDGEFVIHCYSPTMLIVLHIAGYGILFMTVIGAIFLILTWSLTWTE